MIKEKSCGAIIFGIEDKKRKYLLLHYEAGHWDFVKGNVEKGEAEKETVVRETEEETGIKRIVFIEGFRKTINYFYKKEKELVSKQVVFYIAKTEVRKITLSYEHTGYEWLDFDDAMSRITFKSSTDVLREAEDFLKRKSTQKSISDF